MRCGHNIQSLEVSSENRRVLQGRGAKKVFPLHRKNLSVRNLTHTFFVRGAGNNSMTFFDYNYGMGKGIAFPEQSAYALYPSPRAYRYAKERIEEYYHRFNYPKVGGIQYNDGAMCIRMDRIHGRRHRFY